MDHKKQRQNWNSTFPSSSSSLRQLHCSLHSTFSALNNRRMVGIGRLWSTHNCTSLHFLPAPARVLSMGYSSSGWPCSNLDSHMSCREITPPPWSPWAVGLPQYLISLSPSLNLVLMGWFLTFFPPLFTACHYWTWNEYSEICKFKRGKRSSFI